jgi:hypothetical protein
MSARRAIEPKPKEEPFLVEAAAHFKHDGVARRPGDIVPMSTSDAAELIALGFARPVASGYQRRDMKATG